MKGCGAGGADLRVQAGRGQRPFGGKRDAEKNVVCIAHQRLQIPAALFQRLRTKVAPIQVKEVARAVPAVEVNSAVQVWD